MNWSRFIIVTTSTARSVRATVNRSSENSSLRWEWGIVRLRRRRRWWFSIPGIRSREFIGRWALTRWWTPILVTTLLLSSPRPLLSPRMARHWSSSSFSDPTILCLWARFTAWSVLKVPTVAATVLISRNFFLSLYCNSFWDPQMYWRSCLLRNALNSESCLRTEAVLAFISSRETVELQIRVRVQNRISLRLRWKII